MDGSKFIPGPPVNSPVSTESAPPEGQEPPSRVERDTPMPHDNSLDEPLEHRRVMERIPVSLRASLDGPCHPQQARRRAQGRLDYGLHVQRSKRRAQP